MLQEALHVSESQKKYYVFLTILFGLIPAFCYTIKNYVIRVFAIDYKPWDLGIDSLIVDLLCYVFMYIYYIFGVPTPFSLEEFLWGCVVSFLFLIGQQSLNLAYAEGPGGPVNALVMTQSLYQIFLDIFLDHQKVGTWGLIGFVIGVFGILLLSIGNMIMKKFIKKRGLHQQSHQKVSLNI